MHLSSISMISKHQINRAWSWNIGRYASTTTNTKIFSIRSYAQQLLENHRKKIRHEDIRLDPYISKGVYTESGAIRPMPKRYPLGIVKVLLTSIPFLYLGSLVSKYGALALEKMNVYVYSDEDDDDDDDN